MATLVGCGVLPSAPALSQKFKDSIPSNPIVSEGSRDQEDQVKVEEAKPTEDADVGLDTPPAKPPADTTPLCGASGKGCYDDQIAIAAGVAKTPLGKSLVYVTAASGFKVWKDKNSDKILRATGLDEWAMKLNVNGKGLSNAGFTAYTSIVGRKCPQNVYIDDNNKFTTGNCLYYTSASKQTLDIAGTSQTTDGAIGLIEWNTYNGGGAKWYVGNAQACASSGMRLPTIFETNITVTSDASYPSADGSPAFARNNGIPPGSDLTWTASAYLDVTTGYQVWNSAGTLSSASYYNARFLRCVLP